MIFLGLEFDYIFYDSWTLILQSSFHIWLVSMAASTQALITLGSSEQPEQPEQLLRSPHSSSVLSIVNGHSEGAQTGSELSQNRPQ